MSIRYDRSNHGLRVYKTPEIPELHDEMLDFAEANEPEAEEELSF
tara:strand:- start:266 stop:400 length:135 start_codon:yes stop_codon:yes gene_type:complete